jgi:hypothetical protein
MLAGRIELRFEASTQGGWLYSLCFVAAPGAKLSNQTKFLRHFEELFGDWLGHIHVTPDSREAQTTVGAKVPPKLGFAVV